MKERPILFSAPMVKAILAGTKTQTRRVLNTRGVPADELWAEQEARKRPRYEGGDTLWVRETWRPVGVWDGKTTAELAAMFKEPRIAMREHLAFRATDDDGLEGWRPSIFMPRWASRLTLRVASVRVERLHEISEDDARAEGITDSWPEIECNSDRPFREAFEWLWDSINGKRAPWSSNPWVWVVQFARV